MDIDYEERMERAAAAEIRMNTRSQGTRCQTMPVSQGVTVRNRRPRLRGMKRRQRLLVRFILLSRLRRMAAKGIPIPEGVVIP